MEEQHSFDEFFRESLADYRETPPPAAWDMVAARLDDDDRKRRGFFFWPWTVLSLLLLVGGAVWLYGWSTHRSFPTSGKQAQHSNPTPEATDLQSTPAASDRNAPIASNTGNIPSDPRRHATDAGPKTNISSGSTAQTTGTQLPVPSINTSSRKTYFRNGNGPGERFIASRTPRATQVSSGNGRTANSTDAGSAAGTGSGNHAASAATSTTNRPGGESVEITGAQSASVNRSTQPDLRAAGVPGTVAPVVTNGNGDGAVPVIPAEVSRGTGLASLRPAAGTAMPVPGTNASAVAVTPTQTPVNAQTENNAKTSDLSALLPGTGISASRPDAMMKPVPTDILSPKPGPGPDFTTARVPDPLQLLAALEPVMHLFGGAPLPPMYSLYETGLLEPERYFEPIAPAPVVTAATEPLADPAAPAMYPPDSNVKSARRPMSLMAFVGYERGIKTPPRNMFTVGISMLWKLNETFSVGMQPALLYGNMPRTTLTTDRTYQRSAVDVSRFTTRDFSPSILGQIDTVNNYVIREAFDSIIVRGTYIKGSLYHLELPLILQFTPFGGAIRMYGGPSMYFGGSMRIHSEGATQTYTIDRKDSIVQSEKMTEDQIKNYFGKSSLPSYSSYDPNAHSFERLDPVRFGYQFGVGYQKNRLNFDLSVRQQLTGYHQLSSELRQIYALPVFRLSVGYSLIPMKPTAPKTITP